MTLLLLLSGATTEQAPAVLSVYTVDLEANPSPTVNLKSNPTPDKDLKSNPTPDKELKSG